VYEGDQRMGDIKIAVMSDTHANLPALQVAVAAIRAEGYDAIYHLGDAIAIGPQPAECVELLLETPNVMCLMGNHETYFTSGLPQPQPAWMSDGEVEHQHWTNKQLGAEVRQAMASWPYLLEREIEGVRTALMHYALEPSGRKFRPIVRGPGVADLDRLFEAHEAEVVFYGHDHRVADVQGRARYVNPGSLGCQATPVACYCLVEFRAGRCQVQSRAVAYDDTTLFRAFEQRRVPDRAFLYQAFFGGRFKGQDD